MVGILQVFVFLLVIVSFAMVVAVPVILATPGEWEKSQSIVWSGAGLWSALVILTGIFNVVPAYTVYIVFISKFKSKTLILIQSSTFKNRLFKKSNKSPQVGFEPTTNRLTADRSTPELLRIIS